MPPPPAEESMHPPAHPIIDTITLPTPLYQRLLTATELYRISEIKACLEEIEKLDEEKQPLISEINNYLSQYDMEGLIKLLQSITHD